MKPNLFAAVVVVLACLAPTGAPAVEGELPTARDFEQLRAQVEGGRLTDETARQILDLCDGGIVALKTASANRAATAKLEADRSRIGGEVDDLRAELERFEPRPTLQLPGEATIEQAEDALARARSRLDANLETLREQQRLADQRSQIRSGISQRLGELDHELDRLTSERRRELGTTARTELKTAARWNALARRQATETEIARLRARLALLEDRSSLIPLVLDLAERRVEASRERVELYLGRTKELRAEEARASLARVQALAGRLSVELPRIADLAEETERLAGLLWDEQNGVIAKSERTIAELSRIRAHQMQLNRIIELMVRKYSAYGHRGSIQRWWPDLPDDFPEFSSLADTMDSLGEEIPNVEHWLITAEQSRASANETSRSRLRELADELGDELTPELERDVRALLETRQNVLDQLIERGARYSNQLSEHRSVTGSFIAKLQNAQQFLFSHVLWSRSVPRPIIPRPDDLGAALRWLTSPGSVDREDSDQIRLSSPIVLGLCLLALLVVLRPRLRARLAELGRRAEDPERDRPGLTIRALVTTLLLAAPLPLALFLLSAFVGRWDESIYWFAAARALRLLAEVSALLEIVRQVFSRHGLAESHFGWPTTATGPLHRGLLVTQLVGLPLLSVGLHLAAAGMNLYSPEDLQLYNNTLGRVMFVGAMLVIGVALLGMLRPERKTDTGNHDMRLPWPERFSDYAFPTAFLAAYPIVIIATLVPALLAVLGYYITAVLLAYQMLRTLILGVVLLLIGGLIHRGRVSRRRSRDRQRTVETDDDTSPHEIEAAERQARHLFRFSMAALLVVGLLVIWSDALPMLQLLKRVQVFPRVAVLEESDDSASNLLESTQPAASSETTDPTSSGESTTPASTMPMPTAASAEPATEPTEPTVLTLWVLLEAALAAWVTIMLARNLPGVVEILLKRRTTLDSGARVAFSTLVRYSTSIIGTVVFFGLLGVGWSKVQWLAAALTFGLGFGLQEIVANFVSGLILLVERPVRVGDVVTIGTLMGRVSRIQIRATTITLWDRSEMIVPNKEFITTKLVNWTLSDSKRRIEIPLRVAYGADLEEVKRLLVATAVEHPLVLDDPAPHALLIGFGDDAVNFELRFVVDFGNGIQAKDDVQMAIDRSFKEHGIDFALPQLRLQLPEHQPPGSDHD
jgi:potassium efflux system protein